jgi:hypothetical protein
MSQTSHMKKPVLDELHRTVAQLLRSAPQLAGDWVECAERLEARV